MKVITIEIADELVKLKRQNTEMIRHIKRLVDRLEENDFGNMSAVTRAKSFLKEIDNENS